MDLSLIPIDALIKEIENRNDCYVLATVRVQEGNEPIIHTYWTNNKFLDCIGLCSSLDDDIKEYYKRYVNKDKFEDEI